MVAPTHRPFLKNHYRGRELNKYDLTLALQKGLLRIDPWSVEKVFVFDPWSRAVSTWKIVVLLDLTVSEAS
jgi:hypothetical protein